MIQDWCCAAPKGVRLTVQVMPNAKRTEVIGVLGGVLKVRLQAQPIEGRANEVLIRYLAEALDVPRSAIAIVHGHTAKRKVVDIGVEGLTPDTVKHRLA